MKLPRSIAITGLRSFVGKRMLRRVREAGGDDVQLVGVDLQRPYGLDPSVRFHALDLAEPTADARLAELLRKDAVEAVLHAAFRSQPRADLEGDHEFETIGTLHLLNACAEAGVRRLVVASTAMVYGPRPDNPNFLTEDHPLRGHPDAHNVMNRVEVEQLVAAWRARHPAVEVTVLRPCWIMGPSYESPVTRYLGRGVVPTLLGYDPLLQLLHEDDCLHAFETALLDGRPGTFNVVGRGVVPLTTLLRTAGKRPLPIPPPLLYRLGSAPSQAQTGDPPAGFFDYLRYLWVADGERGFAAFGEPEYSTLEAWMSFVSSRRMRRYR
ncbi:MAG TPA: NAD-dependent epimerase/dehydratase family protein [Myxococcota bacterium]|nr:NAD-dependent epimerase/dehydratase family protein [Myxococcota bacterium]